MSSIAAKSFLFPLTFKHMKAIKITAPGTPEVLQLQEADTPTIKENEILIRVKACGINRPDIAQRKGSYPAPPGAPADIPGLEVAGVVESCGSAVSTWKPGDKVVALVAGGGYATHVAADAGSCLPMPENLSFTEAASLPETVFTVWHNVFQRGQLQPGEGLLVHGGSSGIGITVIQIAVALGSTVYTTAGSAEKCKACEDLGAAECINYKEADFEEQLKDKKINVVLDMIGGDYFPKNINLLQPEGRLVFINAMKGGEVPLHIKTIMQKRLSITGSTLRARDLEFKAALATEIQEKVWPLIESGKFKPVIYKTFPLADAAKAHELMESSDHIGKIVLQVEE